MEKNPFEELQCPWCSKKIPTCVCAENRCGQCGTLYADPLPQVTVPIWYREWDVVRNEPTEDLAVSEDNEAICPDCFSKIQEGGGTCYHRWIIYSAAELDIPKDLLESVRAHCETCADCAKEYELARNLGPNSIGECRNVTQ